MTVHELQTTLKDLDPQRVVNLLVETEDGVFYRLDPIGTTSFDEQPYTILGCASPDDIEARRNYWRSRYEAAQQEAQALLARCKEVPK